MHKGLCMDLFQRGALRMATELAQDSTASWHHATKRLMMIQIAKMSESHFHYPY